MPFDFVAADKSVQGSLNYHSGLSAEESVARHYCASGAEVLERRWRGRAGEVDLILRAGAELIFVEVKKGATFAAAAERMTRRQMARIASAAEEFAGSQPDGLLSAMRIDGALVDEAGRIDIIENITLA